MFGEGGFFRVKSEEELDEGWKRGNDWNVNK